MGPVTPAGVEDRAATMKAIVRRQYGSVDVLRLDEVARPSIGDEEVLVRVRAAGVPRSAWHLMTGLPYLVRVAGYGLRTPKNPVLGSEFAGVVESVGSRVRRFGPGDEVFGTGDGAFAEYVRARQDRLAPKPPGLSFEEAAAVPESGVTALQALRDHARVGDGQHVLVIGASGGVGSYAVQIARALGASVTGVSRTDKLDLVRAIGADRVIDYTSGDFAEAGQTYDVILDIGGSRPLTMLRRHLAPSGRLIMVGGEEGGRLIGPLGRSLRGLLLSVTGHQKFITFLAAVRAPDLEFLTGLIEAGKVKPAIDRIYPLSDTAAAIRHLEEGRARGKLVIRVAGDGQGTIAP